MTDFTTAMSAYATELCRATEASTNQSANTSVVNVLNYILRGTGTGRWQSSPASSANAYASGQGVGWSGGYDLRPGSELLINANFTVAHNSDGTGSSAVSCSFSDPTGYIGSGTASGTIGLTTLPQVPGAPTLNSITAITASGATANYSAPGSVGGSAISGYTTQFSTDATFATGVTSVAGDAAADPVSVTGLTPSSTYYARVKATNTQGDSPWSATLSFTTATAGAPHLALFPKWDGSGIWVLLSNPFNTTGASFTVTRSVTGPGAPAPVTITVASGAACFDPLVLATGQTATYQATATIGGSTTGASPSASASYTAVTTKAPVPPIFDGSYTIPSPLGDTLTTNWIGATGVSPTLIYGKQPTGWRTWDQGSAGLTTGVVTQIDDSLATNSGNGQFDVMAIFGGTQSSAGVRTGTEISNTANMASVYAGVIYFGSILVEVDVATRMACEIEWYSSAGLLLGRSQGTVAQIAANTPTTFSSSGTAPVGAVYAAVDIVDVSGTGWAAGSIRFVGSAMLSASSAYPYFDGNTTDTAAYSYSWQGIANASPSLQTALATSGSASALQDPDDPVIPTAPLPPVVDDSQILTDVVWRRYVAAIPAANIRNWMAAVPTLNLFTGANTERQVRIRYWANPNNIAANVWTDAGSTYDSEQIISYIPPNVQFVVDGVAERAYVNFPATPSTPASTVAADHLLFGDGGGPATWPELNCSVGYIITLDVPLTSTPGNITQALELTDRLG